MPCICNGEILLLTPVCALPGTCFATRLRNSRSSSITTAAAYLHTHTHRLAERAREWETEWTRANYPSDMWMKWCDRRKESECGTHSRERDAFSLSLSLESDQLGWSLCVCISFLVLALAMTFHYIHHSSSSYFILSSAPLYCVLDRRRRRRRLLRFVHTATQRVNRKRMEFNWKYAVVFCVLIAQCICALSIAFFLFILSSLHSSVLAYYSIQLFIWLFFSVRVRHCGRVCVCESEWVFVLWFSHARNFSISFRYFFCVFCFAFIARHCYIISNSIRTEKYTWVPRDGQSTQTHTQTDMCNVVDFEECHFRSVFVAKSFHFDSDGICRACRVVSWHTNGHHYHTKRITFYRLRNAVYFFIFHSSEREEFL